MNKTTKNNKKAIIIGAGFAGCTVAHMLAENGWQVKIVEKENFTGGGARTFTYGGHPYTLGPRIFHCPKPREDVFNFMNNMVPLRNLPHHLMTYIEQDKEFYSYPIFEDDIGKMPEKEKIFSELGQRPAPDTAVPRDFEEFWIFTIGKTLYEKYIKEYSKKMWMLDDNRKITDFSRTVKGDAIKKKTREVLIYDWVNTYPKSLEGFNKYFELIENHPNVQLQLNCEVKAFDLENKRIKIEEQWQTADIIVSTISPDILMNNAYGELPYIGRGFTRLVLPHEHILPPNTQFLYNPNEGDFLRAVEYKHLTGYQSKSTLLVLEYPSLDNKLYPLPIDKFQKRGKKYLDNLPKNIYSQGRLGLYKYTNFWEIISDAFELIKKLS